MTLPESRNSTQGTPLRERDFLYSVLNLPRSASDNEIRERYRALSVLFHPDKQRDEATKETASKRFLELQKAYEVLSDPFLREVYNEYGYDGINMKWPAELRSKAPEEVREILTHSRRQMERQKLEDTMLPRGRVALGIDARSLLERSVVPTHMRWTQDLANRVRDVHISSFAIRHTFQKEVSEKTKVFLSSRIARGSARSDAQGLGGGNILGTVRHQYSPRLDLEATATLLRSHLLSLKGVYHDDENALVVETVLSPHVLPPPLTVTYNRRLFSDAPTEGVLVLHAGGQPYLSASVVAPHAFNLTSESRSGPAASSAGSASGLGVGLRQSTYGINLAGIGSSLRADWGVVFSELAVQAKLGVSLSLAGFSWLLSGAWGDEQGGVTTTITLNASGVELKLDMTYLGQRLVVPISLSDDYDALLGLVTATVPTAAFVLAYQFILGPRRQKHRAAFFRAARREFIEERASVRREVEESIALLRDTARRHTQAEKAKEGLVITEATYGPMAPDPEVRDLMVDVTIPLQALVHKSQLYIPGHRTKAGIQGFYDPLPSITKCLRIRYSFGGRGHYAEIPDYSPVVLPLADHLVDGAA